MFSSASASEALRTIALVTDAFGSYGGIAQYNRDFVSALARDERIALVGVLPRLGVADRLLPEGVTQYAPRANRIAYAIDAMIKVLTRRPKIIFNGHLYHGPLACGLARDIGARLVSQLHGTEIWGEVLPAHLAALDGSDLVLCVSRDTRDRYRAVSMRVEDNTLVIPNTVGEAFFPADRSRARARFGLGGELVILTVGRLDPKFDGYKGHDRVMRSMANMQSLGRPLLYLIAGSGADRPRLEALTLQLGLGPSVRFLGKVPDPDLPDLYRAADVFALPSTGEGFGIVYLEAMACGTPAIGLDVGGAPDALEGLGVATSLDAFAYALRTALVRAATMDDLARRDLSRATHAKFGERAFRSNVSSALDVMLCSKPPREPILGPR
jgi:phosphatidylinositol alpha-1,6-mannosyltransferase